ncbi:MAG TPA: HAD family hydrolase [Acidimicrobiia bacterium]|jgi:putative hydrolase of the HAD superfamily|nr:HAD family hydrolase [Acidimicrobiia bacterium]
MSAPSRYDAVIFDFYGTLAESDGTGERLTDIVVAHGYEVPADVARRYWQDGLDGVEHDEHSHSRDHYVAWQRQRQHSLLGECGIDRALAEEIVAKLQTEGWARSMVAYDDTVAMLTQLRAAGVRIAVCSNWDWDLAEALDAAGLTEHVDIVVSSAWVGARKPHARIYQHTLDALGIEADRALFVGDTWNCDVDGPIAHGLRPVYVRRAHRVPDITAPTDRPGNVVVLPDFAGLLDVLNEQDPRVR